MGFSATFFPEGRVDAILLESNGYHAFIDSGYHSDALSCVERLKKRNIDRLDFYIASHRHRNHVGGAAAMLSAFRPRIIYSAYDDMRDAIHARAVGGAEKRDAYNTPYHALKLGESFMLGDATITRIGPVSRKKCAMGSLSENANSLILRVTTNHGLTMLLTGDTSAAALLECEKHGYSIACDVLKNPHHNGALLASVLKKIRPSIIVVCNNTRPAKAYRQRIASIGAKLYSVCKTGEGAVEVREDDFQWIVESARKDGKKL